MIFDDAEDTKDALLQAEAQAGLAFLQGDPGGTPDRGGGSSFKSGAGPSQSQSLNDLVGQDIPGVSGMQLVSKLNIKVNILLYIVI